MSASSAKSPALLGFLSIVNNPDLGLLGGFLLLNAAGRPMEFHCTAPVRPTRTQEILYGPTLKPFLYGEQIALTLLGKSRHRPIAVFTDCEPVLAAREPYGLPLVRVLLDTCGDGGFLFGQARVVTAPGYEADEQQIRAAWPPQAEHLDLCEPFSRIHEALDEAQRAAARAA